MSDGDRSGSPCLDPERLAAFAEGKVERRELPEILQHLRSCPSCMAGVQAAQDAIAGRPRFRTNAWLAAAAVIAIALLAVPQIRERLGIGSRSAPTDRLVALAPRTTRIVEGRLSGGMPWARYRGPMRSTESGGDSSRLKLAGEVGDLVDRADRQHAAPLQHAAGEGLLLIDMPLDAITRLRNATELDPKNAAGWSDLAAAQYAAALQLDRPSLLPAALASADHALRLDPKFAEGRFNRALILERLGLTVAAREAWQQYLAVDAASPWAAEVRQRLARLATTTGEQLFRRDAPRLAHATLVSDATAVAQLVDRYRQQSRTTAEVLTLGQWGEAQQRGDIAGAESRLANARDVGSALVRLSHESLLHDAVATIDDASAVSRQQLAEAHTVYLRARLAYSRHQPAAAESDLRKAAALFAAAGDPLALVARYYVASTRFDQNDVAAARAELEQLRVLTTAQPNYAALAAQVAWELALCDMADDDWQAALPLVTFARDTFQRLGETSNRGFLDALLADTLVTLGRPDDGWRARIRSFEVLNAEGHGDRLPVSLDGAARMELRGGDLEVARSLLQLEESVNRAEKNDVLLTNTLVRESALAAQLGDFASASRQAREASELAHHIDDPALRARAETDAAFATGAAALGSNPRLARASLTRAIDGYRVIERPLFLPEAHLLRARTELRLSDREAASGDLESGIAELERHRIHFAQSVIGMGPSDAGLALFQEAVRLSLDRGDIPAAFSYAERSRAQILSSGDRDRGTPLSISDLQQRLAGSGTALLELVVMPDEVVTFCMTANGLFVSRQRVVRSRLTDLAALGADADDGTAGAELYDLLIRPSDAAIVSARKLIVVADPLLDGVSFAALWDAKSHRHLIERLPVMLAQSAGSLRRDEATALPQSVVAVVLPSGDAEQSNGLPQSRQELREVTALYRHSVALEEQRATFTALRDVATHADVLHIAGHTERQPGAGESALVFAADHGPGRDAISWKNVAATSLSSSPIVVLSACETLRRPHSLRTFSLSLGGGFLAAGAAGVIGTLTPIADNDAREFFSAVHRCLLASPDPAAALQRAQLDAIESERTSHERSPWRAVALLTNRIPHISTADAKSQARSDRDRELDPNAHITKAKDGAHHGRSYDLFRRDLYPHAVAGGGATRQSAGHAPAHRSGQRPEAAHDQRMRHSAALSKASHRRR